MKAVIASLLLCATYCCAQEPKAEPQSQEVKRLAAVTWNLETHKLEWTVEKGTVAHGEFVPATKVKYEVSPDEAYMGFAGEKRAVAADEAVDLRHLLNVLSLYCVESVVWWDQGEGADPVTTPAPGLVTKPEGKPPAKPEEKPVKVDDQKDPKVVKVAAKMQ